MRYFSVIPAAVVHVELVRTTLARLLQRWGRSVFSAIPTAGGYTKDSARWLCSDTLFADIKAHLAPAANALSSEDIQLFFGTTAHRPVSHGTGRQRGAWRVLCESPGALPKFRMRYFSAIPTAGRRHGHLGNPLPSHPLPSPWRKTSSCLATAIRSLRPSLKPAFAPAAGPVPAPASWFAPAQPLHQPSSAPGAVHPRFPARCCLPCR